MVILYLITIIFILLLVILNKKDFFSNHACEYVPWGPSLGACKLNCKSNGQSLWNCNDTECKDKCKNCKNNRCQWITTEEPIESIKRTEEDSDGLIPTKIMLQEVKPVGDDTLRLSWEARGSDREETFIITIYNLSRNIDKVKVINFKSSTSIYDITPDVYNFRIGDEYIIHIYAKNEYGISQKSNKININIK